MQPLDRETIARRAAEVADKLNALSGIAAAAGTPAATITPDGVHSSRSPTLRALTGSSPDQPPAERRPLIVLSLAAGTHVVHGLIGMVVVLVVALAVVGLKPIAASLRYWRIRLGHPVGR